MPYAHLHFNNNYVTVLYTSPTHPFVEAQRTRLKNKHRHATGLDINMSINI